MKKIEIIKFGIEQEGSDGNIYKTIETRDYYLERIAEKVNEIIEKMNKLETFTGDIADEIDQARQDCLKAIRTKIVLAKPMLQTDEAHDFREALIKFIDTEARTSNKE